AVQAHREIRDSLGLTKLSITDIFRFPILSALAAHLDGGQAPLMPKAATAFVASAPLPANAPAEPSGQASRADTRADAMARRRALRTGRMDA
ncbi:MAG: hypothetical protein ACK4NH_17130, partial [Gemmobacter sp.]